MEKVMTIEGMMCMRCVGHVEKALKAVPGVESVVVSLENGTATVTGSASDEALTAAVVAEDYVVKGIA